MKTGIGIAALVGLAILVALIAHHSLTDILALLCSAGLAGLVAVTVFHWIPLACSALGWRALRGDSGHAGPIYYLVGRWIREAVNGLLPVAQIGRPAVGTRLLAHGGLTACDAGASVGADE